MKQQAIKELIDVCEKQVKHYEAVAKRVGLVNIEKSFPIYRPMKKALENINQ